MASNLKRNRVLIKSASDYIKKSFNGNYKIEGGYELVYEKDIVIPIRLFGLVHLQDCPILAIEDTKGRINVGIDVSNIRIVNNYDSVESWVRERLFYALKGVGEYSAILNKLKIDTGYSGGFEDLQSKATNSYYSGRVTEINQTLLFTNIMNTYTDIVHNCKAHLELRDECFKFITSNRMFIPIMIIDLEKGVINYGTDEYIRSDRKARENYRISDFTSSGDIEFNYTRNYYIKSMKIPIGTAELYVEHKNLKRSW